MIRQESARPELIAFSQNKLGGVQSFYRNLLSNDTSGLFKKTWILSDHSEDPDTRFNEPFDSCKKVVFEWSGKWNDVVAIRLMRGISNAPGVILTNHEFELMALRRYPRKNKTIVFICHDESYL